MLGITSTVTTLSHERPHPDRFQQYIEVRDSLLLEQPDRYSATAYFGQLVALKRAERKAVMLQRHIRRLWNHYEPRAGKMPKQLP